MSNQHTPGPWRVVSGKEIGPFPEDFETWQSTTRNRCRGDYEVACTRPRWKIGAPGQSEGEEEANAHLIAAAPELLAALKLMVSRFEERAGERPHAACGCSYCAALEAIGKAEGFKPPKLSEDEAVRYTVTRWCCSSGDCIRCHTERERGGPVHPNTAARTRIVQGDNLTKKQAEKFFVGWNAHGYEPKIEQVKG